MINDFNRGVDYLPAGPVVKAFMESESFVRGIMGPIGSGKSTACVIEILRRANLQTPGPDGIRRSRWAVIRNSFPELKSTTIKTWFEWVPQAYGKSNFDSPIIHHVKTQDLDLEVFFMALDKPEDARKLLSLELTGAWINEAREIPKAIVDTLTGRVGRYPNKNLGGCTWSGIIMDTNPPDNQSWWYKLSEEETPQGFRFFKQPSGLSPDAENILNLPSNYYQRLIGGKDPEWVKIYVHGEYGFLNEGQSVYPMFRDRLHISPESVTPTDQLPLLIGCDFGLTPAAIIGQRLADGRWLIIDELITENCGVTRFAELLSAYVANKFPYHEVSACWGDPAGNQRSFSDESTALEIMNNHTKWRWLPAPGDNTLTIRLEVVMSALNRLVDGNPGILISPKCEMLRKGFNGGYHYKLLKSGNGTQTHETPNKNQYSHAHDALQYLLLGGGEHNVVMGRKKRTKRPTMCKTDYSPFGSTGTGFSND